MDKLRLPSLTALRAFEAAARHQNFSRAAEEIHLTHGAISHQVRQLEEELGVQLFARNGKRLSLTEDGARFAEVVRKSLQDIAEAAQRVSGHARGKRLAITALPSFAARWLAPRLGHFIERHPDLEVSLQSSSKLNDYGRDSIDAGIRFGYGRYPDLVAEYLFDDCYYPVASPQFNGGQLPKTPQEIVRMPLLRCEQEEWSPWLRAAGLDMPEPTAGLIFEDASMVVRAAVEGHGVALARHAIVHADIASGALLRLSPVSIPSDKQYFLVYPPEGRNRPQVMAFRDWILEEVQAFHRVGGACLAPQQNLL